VVVTYFPTQDEIENIVASSHQVDKLIVVDNGSNNDDTLLALIKRSTNITVRLLRENKGIAFANNIGFSEILKEETPYEWLLTLDQDSIIPENYIKTLITCYEKNKNYTRIGVLSPNIYQKDIDSEYSNPILIFSSGRLIHKDTIKNIGLEREDFFIDGVDFEYCLRMKKKNIAILQVNTLTLGHKLGEKKHITLLGKRLEYTEYSPIRRYYSTRNHLVWVKEYLFLFPKTCINMVHQLILGLIKILIIEENKGENYSLCGMDLKIF
jgi:rhamnosyltransferase